MNSGLSVGYSSLLSCLSSVAINTRDAVQRNTDLSLNEGAYVLEKYMEVAQDRVGGKQDCSAIILQLLVL